MANSLWRWALLGLLVGVCAVAGRADEANPRWFDVQVPRDSPVVVVSFGMGPTTVRARGISMVLDLHASLVMRNVGTKPLCGLTMRVEAQDLTPSGKGSVTTSSLDVQPGEVFPVRIDLELERPFNTKIEGSIVQVSLDCALFGDLSAYGPDKLGSKRALLVYELEARRDRQYLARLLDSGRTPQLREELNFGLEDMNPPQIGLELLHPLRPNAKGEQAVQVGVVSFPKGPVQPMGGAARLYGNEVRSPQVDVKNTSQKTVRSIEMGWILRDERGRDFMAGSAPAAMQLGPVQSGRVSESGTLRFSRPTGQPMVIGAITAFVNNVEFADGKLWIPTREDINSATSDPLLRRALAASPEQQRLAELYRKKGINALQVELKKSN